MSKVLSVVRFEYSRSVRSKAFVVGVLLMPILMGAGLIIIGVSEAVEETGDKQFAVVDRTGDLLQVIEGATEQRNAAEIWSEDDPEDQEHSRFLAVAAPMGDSESGPELALAERVRSDELIGYLVIGSDVTEEDGADRTLAWHTATPNYRDLPNWLSGVLNAELRKRRALAAGLDEELVRKIVRRDPIRSMGLPEVSETGEVIAAEESDELAYELIPIVLAMLLYMLIMMSAPALLNSVLEEKMQKISEVLVSAISPFQLLTGKLLATAGIALTLALIYLGAGLVFVHNVDRVPTAVLEALRPGVLAWFLVFLVMALLIYGSIFSALGAASSEIQDAQSMMAPAMILVIFPMFFLGVVLESPNSTISQLVSFFPPATPVLMMIRVAVPPGVALWELLLAFVLTGAFAALSVGVAGKIFRIGILAQGQTPSYGKLIRWVMSK